MPHEDAIARILVYSMSFDGEVRESQAIPGNKNAKDDRLQRQTGFVGGSKAMDSLDRLITSIETFFHPSNTGLYTLSVQYPFMASLASQLIIITVDNFHPTFKC